MSGKTLLTLADAAERAGSRRIRFTPLQKIVVLDVVPSAVEALIADLAEAGLQARPSPWRRSVMACTGIEFCKLAIVETRPGPGGWWTSSRRLREVDLDGESVHLNGCPNSCAHQVADIGLKGQIVTDTDGRQVEGFQVHLGGGVGLDAGFGRKLRGHKVTSAELGDYVVRVVTKYAAQREPCERFAQWVGRAEEGDLR